jgi:hypothetical protein
MCGPTPAYCTRLMWQVPNLLRAQQHNIAIMLEWENLSTLQFYTHIYITIYLHSRDSLRTLKVVSFLKL